MKQLWGKVSLKGQVMLFTSLIVILSLLILSLFVAYNQSKNTKDNLAEKVQISASHIAYNTLIQDSLLVGETNQELID